MTPTVYWKSSVMIVSLVTTFTVIVVSQPESFSPEKI